MSFAWLDYLVLAEALLQVRTTLAPEEACCRAGISHAYYAVYGAARTRARDQEGLQLPATGDAHQRVITHYRQGPSPLHRAIGNNLRRLRRAQQVAAPLQALAPPPPAPNDTSAPPSPESTEER